MVGSRKTTAVVIGSWMETYGRGNGDQKYAISSINHRNEQRMAVPRKQPEFAAAVPSAPLGAAIELVLRIHWRNFFEENIREKFVCGVGSVTICLRKEERVPNQDDDPEEQSLEENPTKGHASTSAWMDETYREMMRLAAHAMLSEAQTVSMTPTVLVHEVYLRLAKQSGIAYGSRAHFLAVASTMMRRILVDHARSRLRTKRGGQFLRVVYDEDLALSKGRDADVLALDEALDELAKLDPRQSRIVEMRFFGGMTVPEVAEELDLSTRTIENEWKLSRAWLRKRLGT